ncbi:hypothetical protein T10_171 [Trichinella papuae]|uniref:Uncharacterized protein n=1 Tax=Trichinella papuae TaxID=268474 RepID=A0A0V1MJU8_9BILA|nr:hypothetical protein T10_171 [Trichinella papuae]
MTSVLIITFTNKAEQILLKLPIYEQINFNGFCKYYIIIENFHRFKANNFTQEKVKLLKCDIVIDGRESNKMNDVLLSGELFYQENTRSTQEARRNDWLRRWTWLAKKKMAHIIFCVDYRKLNQ